MCPWPMGFHGRGSRQDPAWERADLCLVGLRLFHGCVCLSVLVGGVDEIPSAELL